MTARLPTTGPRLGDAFDVGAVAVAVVEGLNDAVVVADTDGRILYVNPAGGRIMGWEPADLVGRPIATVVPERLRALHVAGLERFVRTGEARVVGQPTRVPILAQDGSERPVELVLSSCTLADGTPAIAATIRDVADRLDLERQSALAHHLLGVFARDLTEDELIDEILGALGRSLDMQAAAFWVPDDPDQAVLACRAYWSAPGTGPALGHASRRLRFRTGEGLPGRVWASGSSSWIEDLTADPNYWRDQQVVADGLRSGFAFPVRARRRTLGVIELYTRTPSRTDPSLLDQVEVMGRRLGEVIFSAQVDQERRQLAERERVVAAAFRESLLPEVLPEIAQLDIGAAFLPGGEGVVGGDFYDLYLLDTDGTDQRWAFTIGDVCGTGPAAAAVTAKVRYTVRALSRIGLPLATIASQVNTALVGRRDRRFCTAIFGSITVTPDRIGVQFVNAGHLPPVLRRRSGETTLVPHGGPLLGVLPQVSLHQQELELDLGDVLVLYTDGVTEAREGASVFGEERLIALVAEWGERSAGAAADHIQRVARLHAGGAITDDMAVLVLRRTQ